MIVLIMNFIKKPTLGNLSFCIIYKKASLKSDDFIIEIKMLNEKK